MCPFPKARPKYIAKVAPSTDAVTTLCPSGERLLSLLCPTNIPGVPEYRPTSRRQLQISAIPGEYSGLATAICITMRGSPPKGMILVGLQSFHWGRRIYPRPTGLSQEEILDILDFLGTCGIEWGVTPDTFRLNIGGEEC
jgi:hypothetical protein